MVLNGSLTNNHKQRLNKVPSELILFGINSHSDVEEVSAQSLLPLFLYSSNSNKKTKNPSGNVIPSFYFIYK